jgi:hypothetical protein
VLLLLIDYVASEEKSSAATAAAVGVMNFCREIKKCQVATAV